MNINSRVLPHPLPSAISLHCSTSHVERSGRRQRLWSEHDSLVCWSWLEADLELHVRLCNDLRHIQGYIKDQTAGVN